MSLIVSITVTVSFLLSCGSTPSPGPTPEQQEYFVTFVSNGGSHVDTQRVKEGATASYPDEPTYGDAEFKGWYLDNEVFEQPYMFTEPVIEDITLYAKWDGHHDNYLFTFHGANCKVNGDYVYTEHIVPQSKELSFTVIPDENYSLPINPRLPSGVHLEGNLLKVDVMNKNISVAINAASKYSFTLNGTDCTINGETDFKEDLVPYTEAVYTIFQTSGCNQVTIDEVLIDGKTTTDYTFKDNVFVIKMMGNVVVTAHGNAIYYTVTFDPNGGELSPTSKQTLKAREGVALKDVDDFALQNATKDGLVFKGWALTPTATTSADKYIIKGNITVYAIFVASYETVTLSLTLSNCNLYTSFGQLIVGEETSLTKDITQEFYIEPTSNYLPVLIDDMTFSGFEFSYFIPKEHLLIVKALENCSIEASATIVKCAKLDEYTWPDIDKISRSGLAPTLFKIGDTKKLKFNDSTTYDVRIIGFDHDHLSNGAPNQNAGITFEFVQSFCDDKGHSLAVPWNWENAESSTNDNFLNSNLCRALDGTGMSNLAWYEKESPTRSTYYIESIIDMLFHHNRELYSLLKIVDKPIALNKGDSNFEVDTKLYHTKLFCLSVSEISDESYLGALKEGETYEYYKNHKTNEDRIHYQLKDADQTFISEISITDSKCSDMNKPRNYAGWSKPSVNGGSFCHLRSPFVYNAPNSRSWCIAETGEILSNFTTVYQTAISVVPAFCI